MADHKPHLLIVEDDPIMILFLDEYLAGTCTISKATTGAQALSLLGDDAPFSLVVLDLHMPEVDGFQVLSHIRSNPKLNRMPVVVLSGSLNSADRVKALQSGADDFVVKPFNPEELQARIQNLMRRFGSA